jgi:hypothetical protein
MALTLRDKRHIQMHMKAKHCHSFIQLFVIIGLIAASLSPLCHMRGGNGLIIQICKADGSAERVAASPSYLPDEFKPFLLGENEEQPETPTIQKQCPFCFFDMNLGIAPDAVLVLSRASQYDVSIGFSSDQIRSYRRYIMPPSRGPPPLNA